MSRPVVGSVLTPGRVARGQPVAFALALRNVRARPIHLELGLPEPAEFVVTRVPDGAVLWRSLAGRVALNAQGRDPIAPGATWTFGLPRTWAQRDTSGRPVPAGPYCVNAVLSASVARDDVQVDAAPLWIE